MEGLDLLTRARAAGLVVEAEGGELVVRGPKRAAAVAMKLLAHKAAVLAALEAATVARTGATGQEQHERTITPEPVVARRPGAGMPEATITVKGKTYDLQRFRHMRFFQFQGHPDAGWTCCSQDFLKIIEAEQ